MREPHRLDRIQRRLADGVFYLLLTAAVVLAGWLGARHDHYWDWTSSARNTLSAESLAVVGQLDGKLRITVFLDPNHPLAKTLEQVLARYRRALPDLTVDYVDPQRFPQQARTAQVTRLGEMRVEYRGREETVTHLGEEPLTAAIARLARTRHRWVVFLEGHGERAIAGESGTDLGRFAHILSERGYRLQTLDLATENSVPDNTDLLVVSTPIISLFPGEAERLVEYLSGGGNLLWLMDPGDLQGLDPVAEALGISPLAGMLVDANVQALGINDPTVAMVAHFPDHPLTSGLAQPVLFPGSLGFLPVAKPHWRIATPLETLKNSWNEMGTVRGEVSRDDAEGEQPGPLPLALVLTREHPPGGEQRVLVLGDGDFLSNAHLNMGGNRVLALRLTQWLTAPAGSLAIPRRVLPDRSLNLTRTHILIIGGGSLVVAPLLLLVAGILIRRQRRRE